MISASPAATVAVAQGVSADQAEISNIEFQKHPHTDQNLQSQLASAQDLRAPSVESSAQVEVSAPTLATPKRFQEIDLGAHVQAELRTRLSKLALPDRYDCERFIRGGFRSIVNTVPDEVLELLLALKDSPQPSGALLIKNCPVDLQPGRTPSTGLSTSPREVPIAKAFLLGVARIVGTPYSYRVEKGGDLVHYVVPVAGKEKSLTNMGSIDELGFHTELAYFNHQPRRLILLCLRPDHEREAQTPISDVRDALEVLSPEDVEELRKPQFSVRCPFIFDPMLKPEERYSRPRPVVSGPVDRPEVRVALYGQLTRSLTPAGERALQALDLAVRKVAHHVRLDRGDMVILDNCTVLHARTSFTPRFDGQDRWLVRCHVADSLWTQRDIQRDSMRVLAS
jgi:L-asparagine oxygenase